MRYITPLALLLFTASCSHQVVTQIQYVPRTLVVHDTVSIAQDGTARHPLDQKAWGVLSRHSYFTEHTNIGVCVADLDTGDTLVAIDANKRLRTASTMKAITAITALATVADTANAFATRVMTDGNRLWVRGGYDPLISRSEVEGLARRAASRAALVMTAARAASKLRSGCSDAEMRSAVEQAMRSKTAALPTSLACNTDGQDTRHYGNGWCWDDHNPQLTPLFYGPITQTRKRQPIDRPEEDFMNVFNNAWRSARATSQPTEDEVMAMLRSKLGTSQWEVAAVTRSLSTVMRPMLKESDNLMAEAVWRLTGNTTSERADAMSRVARMAGVSDVDYVQADGSGLSLYDYCTPSAFVKLLSWADRQRFVPWLRAALPHMGVDGTLANRSVYGARIEAKTGTVEGVITLVGYMTTTSGRRLAFAVMMNGVPSKSDAREVTDALLTAIANGV